MTKKELEDLVKQLKSEIRDLKKESSNTKEAAEGIKDSDHLGFSVIKQDGHFKLVRLRFDIDSGRAGIESIDDVHKLSKDFSMAEHFSKKFLIEEIIDKLEVH